jgi:hypothetical protein
MNGLIMFYGYQCKWEYVRSIPAYIVYKNMYYSQGPHSCKKASFYLMKYNKGRNLCQKGQYLGRDKTQYVRHNTESWFRIRALYNPRLLLAVQNTDVDNWYKDNCFPPRDCTFQKPNLHPDEWDHDAVGFKRSVSVKKRSVDMWK